MSVYKHRYWGSEQTPFWDSAGG
uniref:Uncharacterized protein n=1 Tax=Arundo donax TaxID=35708 RepID=A0A0A9AAR4_ARUDO